MNKNVLVGLITVTCLFGGLIAAVAAWNRLENYFHVLRFILIFIPIGFLIGMYVRKKLRQLIERNIPAELQKSYSQFGTVAGFIGFTLYFATFVNSGLSSSTSSREHIHTKWSTKGNAGPRNSVVYVVVVTVNGKPERIRCSYEYWNKLSVNDTIPVIFHNSPIGFDFVELPEDN